MKLQEHILGVYARSKSHQPDRPCALWIGDRLDADPALPAATEEPFQDILLAALTLRIEIRAARVNRYLVEQLRLPVCSVTLDCLLDLIVLRMTKSRRRVLDMIEGTVGTRASLPGKLALVCSDGVVFLEDGWAGRATEEAYCECVARTLRREWNEPLDAQAALEGVEAND